MNIRSQYLPLLQEMEGERDDMNAAIRAMRKYIGLGPGDSVVARTPDRGDVPEAKRAQITIEPRDAKPPMTPQDVKVRPGCYTGLSVWKAALKHLQAAKKPQTTKQLVQALNQGGLGNHVKKFDANLHQAMTNKPAVFRKVDVGLWDLVQ